MHVLHCMHPDTDTVCFFPTSPASGRDDFPELLGESLEEYYRLRENMNLGDKLGLSQELRMETSHQPIKAVEAVLYCFVVLLFLDLYWFCEVKGFPSKFVSTSVWSESDLQVFGDSLIPPAAESDLLRLYLLNKYGGVWVDSTNLCRRPLDDWLPSAARQGFFAFFPDLQSPEHQGVPHIISSA